MLWYVSKCIYKRVFIKFQICKYRKKSEPRDHICSLIVQKMKSKKCASIPVNLKPRERTKVVKQLHNCR